MQGMVSVRVEVGRDGGKHKVEVVGGHQPVVAVTKSTAASEVVLKTRDSQAPRTDFSHGILAPSVLKAAKEWVVDPSSVKGNSVLVAIRFQLDHCGGEK